MEPFATLESDVRYYCRRYPALFVSARNAVISDADGREYIDFLAGAGALNYGHNNPQLIGAVVDYLQGGGILHALDLHTAAKRDFLSALDEVIFAPRGLRYKVQLPGPTGNNAVEAALKLARVATGREGIVAFTNAFHGVTVGALAVTGDRSKRQHAGPGLHGVLRLPFENYGSGGLDGLTFLDDALHDPSSGIDLPAAVIVETLQAEGGLNVASPAWLQRLEKLCHKHGILLIVDDIQAGCGRTGAFFSFEDCGIRPDIVCLSKSIGGLGLPLALVLFKPELDRWRPGQHNGTFRGHNLAFVAGARALDYWRTPAFEQATRAKAQLLQTALAALAAVYPAAAATLCGRGLLQGLRFANPELADRTSLTAFRHGLIIETCGPRDEVLKIMPPLTIEISTLNEGLARLQAALAETLDERVTAGA